MPDVLALSIQQPTLLGIAAIISAIGGIASTIMAVRSGRHEEHKQAMVQLTEREVELAKCRAEGERLAKELHGVRMKEYES